MAKSKKTCDCCGASMVQYKHRLSAILVSVLKKLNDAGGETNLQNLGLERTEWDNFQKLRYWGLVAKTVGDNGKRKSGTWTITDTGRQFLAGLAKMQVTAVTYRGQTVGFEGVHVSINSLLDGSYKQKHEYGEDSVAVAP